MNKRIMESYLEYVATCNYYVETCTQEEIIRYKREQRKREDKAQKLAEKKQKEAIKEDMKKRWWLYE